MKEKIVAINRDEVRKFAGRFREAIDRTDRTQLSISFNAFPRGACGDTSLLLGAALKDHGLGSFRYVCGSKSQDSQFESHAWLDASGLIVDITADQFEGLPSVFVGEDEGWYKTWDRITDLGEGDHRQVLGGYGAGLESSYRLILANLR